VTPDELGDAWDGGRLSLPLRSFVNGAPLGRPDAGKDMTFDFPRLIAHAARTRALSAGTIIGSGTISNRDADGGPGRPIAQGGDGYSCIAEQRVVEKLTEGAPHAISKGWRYGAHRDARRRWALDFRRHRATRGDISGPRS
jgi:fumarylacetoacetate (FAA) hydrolase